MDFNLINVGIADVGVSSSPDILRTILGSCVGICLYDSARGNGGIAHIMLPTSKKVQTSIKKYADTAIPYLIEELEKKGSRISDFKAKIVGGATMFNLSENSVMGEIGKNNIAKVKEVLAQYNIEIIAEEVGGNHGRTIDFYLETGEIKIKSIGMKDKTI